MGPAARSGSAARAGIPGAEARWARRDWGGFRTYAGLASRPDCRPQGPESGPKGGVANGIGRVARSSLLLPRQDEGQTLQPRTADRDRRAGHRRGLTRLSGRAA